MTLRVTEEACLWHFLYYFMRNPELKNDKKNSSLTSRTKLNYPNQVSTVGIRFKLDDNEYF